MGTVVDNKLETIYQQSNQYKPADIVSSLRADRFALRNYLKIIMKVHKEKLNNFERIIAMMASIFVDTVYSNQSSLNDKGEY